MILKDFMDTLKNIENDKMLMSYGDNQNVVSSILSVANLVESLSSIIRSDRGNDMFVFQISNKIVELENMIQMYGMQRLMERGIMGAKQQYVPFMPNAPMYNQQMYYPNMMYNQMPPMQQGYNPMMQQQMQVPPQMQAPQYIPPPPPQAPPQMQQQMPQAPAAPAPQQPAAPAPQAVPQAAAPAAPKPAPAPPANTEVKSSGGGASAGFSLPGLDGGGGGGADKAAGRDFLLKLLEER